MSTVVLASGAVGHTEWRHYGIISDGQVEWVEYQPAAWVGWKVVRRWKQGDADWPGMDAARILAWLLANNDRLTVVTDPEILEAVMA